MDYVTKYPLMMENEGTKLSHGDAWESPAALAVDICSSSHHRNQNEIRISDSWWQDEK